MSLPPTLPPSSSIQLIDEFSYLSNIVPSSTDTTQASLQGFSDLTQANVTQATTRSTPLMTASSVTPTTSLQHRECSDPADHYIAELEALIAKERVRAKRPIYATGSDDSQSQGSSAKQARMATQAPWTIDSDHTQTRAYSPNQDQWQSLLPCQYASTSHFPAVTQSQQQMQFNHPITAAQPVLSDFYTNQPLPQATTSSSSTYTPYASNPMQVQQRQHIQLPHTTPVYPSWPMMPPANMNFSMSQMNMPSNIALRTIVPPNPSIPPHTPIHWDKKQCLSVAQLLREGQSLEQIAITQSASLSYLNQLKSEGRFTSAFWEEKEKNTNTLERTQKNCMAIWWLLNHEGLSIRKAGAIMKCSHTFIRKIRNSDCGKPSHWELDDTQADTIGRRHAETLGYKPSTSS